MCFNLPKSIIHGLTLCKAKKSIPTPAAFPVPYDEPISPVDEKYKVQETFVTITGVLELDMYPKDVMGYLEEVFVYGLLHGDKK